jgi:hypothetical protein
LRLRETYLTAEGAKAFAKSTKKTKANSQQLIANSLFLRCLLGEAHQFFGHPLAESFLERAFDADRAVVPLVGVAGRAALALVALSLLQAERDAVNDVAPVLLLYAAADEREARRPVLFGRVRGIGEPLNSS